MSTNKILLCALLLVGQQLFSQAFFSSTSNTYTPLNAIFSNCVVPDDSCILISDCSDWTYEGYESDEPMICNLPSSFNFTFCSIKETNISKQKLNAFIYFDNLEPSIYKRAKLDIEVFLPNELNPGNELFLEVTVGQKVYHHQVTTAGLEKISVEFCSNENFEPISISIADFGGETEVDNEVGIKSMVIQHIRNCDVICPECTSFELLPEQQYVISGWVKEKNPPLANQNSDPENETSSIIINFIEDESETIPEGYLYVFTPTGAAIDGWKKITGTFSVPADATSISIELEYLGGEEAYFDDIRIHPINSNLKSFVYDQNSQKLMAELDENNYATFYEYDNEGGLVRVKKETERGIHTIQETRSSTKKTAETGDIGE